MASTDFVKNSAYCLLLCLILLLVFLQSSFPYVKAEESSPDNALPIPAVAHNDFQETYFQPESDVSSGEVFTAHTLSNGADATDYELHLVDPLYIRICSGNSEEGAELYKEPGIRSLIASHDDRDYWDPVLNDAITVSCDTSSGIHTMPLHDVESFVQSTLLYTEGVYDLIYSLPQEHYPGARAMRTLAIEKCFGEGGNPDEGEGGDDGKGPGYGLHLAAPLYMELCSRDSGASADSYDEAGIRALTMRNDDVDYWDDSLYDLITVNCYAFSRIHTMYLQAVEPFVQSRLLYTEGVYDLIYSLPEEQYPGARVMRTLSIENCMEPYEGEEAEGENQDSGEDDREGEGPTEGEAFLEGEMPGEGEEPVEGEESADGEMPVEGEPPSEGEYFTEGEELLEGEQALEGEALIEGETPTEGESFEGEALVEEETVSEGETHVEGEGFEGEPFVEGEFTIEGETVVEGEAMNEGEWLIEGESHMEGENLEGETSFEGESFLEGEVLVEGETPEEGEALVEGESPIEGELALEGESLPEGEAITDTEFPDGCGSEDSSCCGCQIQADHPEYQVTCLGCDVGRYTFGDMLLLSLVIAFLAFISSREKL